MKKLNEQELHNLAMNIVGRSLEEEGYEFLGVNSTLKKDPQFVALKDKNLHFVIVRVVAYPEDPDAYDPIFMHTIKAHADKFEAKTFYAGIGLGHAEDFSKPVLKDEPYGLIFNGLIEIK